MRRIPLVLTIGMLLSAMLAAQSSAPEDLVNRLEKQTTNFLDLFSNVKCTEYVEQQKLTAKGKLEFKTDSRYDYLLISAGADGEMDLQEARLEEQAAQQRQNLSLLLTNGFATQLLVFHPYYRTAYEFTDAGVESLNGHTVRKIAFRHITGQKTPAVLMLRGREYPLEMKGTAWVEPETGRVERMQSELQVDMNDIGLKSLQTDVTYSPVHFRGMADAAWLPSKAEIEVATQKQRWRNIHRFERYQHFGVDTEHVEDSSSVAKKAE